MTTEIIASKVGTFDIVYVNDRGYLVRDRRDGSQFGRVLVCRHAAKELALRADAEARNSLLS